MFHVERRYVYAIGLLALALCFQTTPLLAQAIRVGPITEIMRESEPRRPIEPHLAVSPTNPDHLLAAVMIGRFGGTFLEVNASMRCATFLSQDGGKTWKRHDFPMVDCYDPQVAITSSGDAVFVTVATNPPQPGNTWLTVYHSPDGGATWDATPTYLGAGHDQPNVVVDLASPRRKDWIYISSHLQARADDGNLRRSVFVGRSRDGGKTFDVPVHTVPNNLSNLAEASAVLTDGTLFVSFAESARPVVLNSGDRPIFDRRRGWTLQSSDGGFTFSMPRFITDACGPPPNFQRSTFVADTTNSAFRDRLYYLCRQAGGGPIVVASSADRGERWTQAVPVDSGPRIEAPNRIVAAAVDGRGVLAVAWLERRVQTGDICQVLTMTASLDGGRTFLPPQRVSAAPCDESPTSEQAFRMFPTNGDYFGLVSQAPGRFRLTWAESRNGATLLLTTLVALDGA